MNDALKLFRGSDDYVVTEELMHSVNLAIALERPLLVKGEPGTGKTMLAMSIAQALSKELIIWSIKSTTKAKDGLYMYDTVQRLYDSQFQEGNVGDIKRYIKLGKLGEALTAPSQPVLLIDEIDKADLEFPNDLLWELDKMEFYIHETKEVIKGNHRPIVIITSNAEKELPDPFLRRLVFHYIAFPGPDQMREIIAVHFPNLESKLLDQALEAFYWLRGVRDLQKKPSTSELIDWLRALMIGGVPIEGIREKLPFLGVLLKKNQDMDVVHGLLIKDR